MKESLIELRLWRQFLAVADELHFGRAAVRLHMTQPPLTQAIAHLESQLGVRLFDRTKRRVQLTEAGAALVPEASQLLARAQALQAQARLAGEGGGRLRLAFISTVGYTLLPNWVRAWRSQHPHVQLDLVEATGDLQLQALARGDVDAGFLLHAPGFVPPDLPHLRVLHEPLLLAIAQSHRLASARSVPLRQVWPEPLLMFPRRNAPSLHDAIFGLYHAAGATPQVVQEAIQMQTLVNLVSAGLGLAWVPEGVSRFQRPGVVYRSPGAAGRPALRCETSLVWRAEGGVALERFVAFAREQVRAAQ